MINAPDTVGCSTVIHLWYQHHATIVRVGSCNDSEIGVLQFVLHWGYCSQAEYPWVE